MAQASENPLEVLEAADPAEAEGTVGLAAAEDLRNQSSSSKINSLADEIQRGLNTDFKIHINGSHFDVHLDILQSATRMFDPYQTGEEMTIPADKVAPEIFDIIYDWIVDKHPPMPRDKLPALLEAAEYLQMPGLTWYLKCAMGEGKGDFINGQDPEEDDEIEEAQEEEAMNAGPNRPVGAGDEV